jgi:hypothetical protein
VKKGKLKWRIGEERRREDQEESYQSKGEELPGAEDKGTGRGEKAGEEEDQGFLPSMLDRQTERQEQRERHTTGVVTETLAGLLRPPPGLSLTTPSPSPSRPPPPLPYSSIPSLLSSSSPLPSISLFSRFFPLLSARLLPPYFWSSSVPSFASPPLAIFRPAATAVCSSLTVGLPGRLLRFLVLFVVFLWLFPGRRRSGRGIALGGAGFKRLLDKVLDVRWEGGLAGIGCVAMCLVA